MNAALLIGNSVEFEMNLVESPNEMDRQARSKLSWREPGDESVREPHLIQPAIAATGPIVEPVVKQSKVARDLVGLFKKARWQWSRAEKLVVCID